ncbi:BMP family ABC transporter substrate-binding protein [Nakamurella sp. YIM 132087]|uniref:BMP family ABC transporter substrate-binding protein n=1 Tax=Nakamurella alba TaxID=2665158 RepID=A0A7K1FK30_9ACTN|nr:BMP family ABC transporter substrate-binding protein [Nakamurella alba]MTD13214.1 BMP family ABC transporter substrate-binding protein [Nakamurella alba]
MLGRGRGLAGILATAVLLISACGDGGVTESTTTGAAADSAATSASSAAGSSGSAAAPVDYTGCLMVSSVGVADRSFNQQAWDAMQQAQDTLGITVKYLAQSGSIDYPQMGDQFVQEGCDLIVGMGFNTTETIERLAPENPDTDFILIDDAISSPQPNVSSLHYQTDQASFLAGYLAAGMSKTGTIGVVGNVSIPPVELYMDGYVNGVKYYAEQKSADVKAIGWDTEARTGTFVGNFTDTNKGKLLVESEIQQGADIVLALIGGGAEAIRAAGGPEKGYYLFWPDTDGCITNEADCDLFLSSVLKNIQVSLFDVVSQAVAGDLPDGVYEGTLANEGVGIAPFHDADAAVPQALKDELVKVQADIVAGTITTS